MKKLITSLFLLATILAQHSIHACTDFRIAAKDGTMLMVRSMEFAMQLNSNIRTSTRNRQFVVTSPNGKPGMAWKAKYGYVYLDGLNQDFAIDGINEEGLAFEALYLPGETQYQTVPAGRDGQSLPYILFGDWVLSNFKTVDEVRAILPNVFVFTQNIEALGNLVFPLHFAIEDKFGKAIVVEFAGGQMQIYDNTIGVMTNSPTYSWQMTNLRNYLNLSPYSPQPITINGVTFSATGQGAGTVGLPGDISPPSRFVKTTFLLKVVYPPSNAADALNLGQHIINNVDIPAGLARAISNGKESAETTQWVVFKDMTHKIFYYRTYQDLTIHAIALDKLDFNENAVRLKMPLNTTPVIIDETDKFRGTKLSALQ